MKEHGLNFTDVVKVAVDKSGYPTAGSFGSLNELPINGAKRIMAARAGILAELRPGKK